MEQKTPAEETAQRIEDKIEEQAPALEASDWAEEPQLTPEQEQALLAAAKGASAAVEFDDTNGADDDPAPAPAPRPQRQRPTPPPAPETADVVPAGEEADPPVGQEPEFDPSLLEAAGLASADEAKVLFGTPKALENAVRLIDQRAVNLARGDAPPTPAQPAQPVAQTTIPANTAAAEPTFEMPAPPDGEEWDEATVALVTGLQKQFAEQLKVQRELLERQQKDTQQILHERQEIERRRYIEDFDSFVQQLPETWDATLGKQTGYELAPESVQMKARIHLDQTAKLLADGRAKQGHPPLALNDLLSRALRVAFPQQQEQAVRKAVESEVAKRERMKTARPSGRTPAQSKSGEEAAADFASRWYAKRGMAPLPFDDEEYDEI